MQAFRTWLGQFPSQPPPYPGFGPTTATTKTKFGEVYFDTENGFFSKQQISITNRYNDDLDQWIVGFTDIQYVVPEIPLGDAIRDLLVQCNQERRTAPGAYICNADVGPHVYLHLFAWSDCDQADNWQLGLNECFKFSTNSTRSDFPDHAALAAHLMHPDWVTGLYSLDYQFEKGPFILITSDDEQDSDESD